MKIILLEDVKGKGKKYQIITAADGYCTFLIRQNKALPATSDNLKLLEKKLAEQEALHNKNIEEANELKTFDEKCVVLVPRGVVDVLVYSRDDGYVSGKEGLVIPYGEDCPEVYMHFLSVEAAQEEVEVDVVLRKNYCNATICVATEDEFPYRLSLHGNVMGYGVDSRPAAGDFMYEFELDEDRTGMVSLPRQMDTSLSLL